MQAKNDNQTGESNKKAEPSFLKSYQTFVFGTWLNLALIAVPFSFLSHFLHWGASWTFIISFIAIVPLASVRLNVLLNFGVGHLTIQAKQMLGDATEQCSMKVGQTLGGRSMFL